MRIIVTIEPGGDAARSREIAELEIWNRSELAEVSDYGYELRQSGGLGRVVGSVDGHRRSDGWEPLVLRVLQSIAAPPLRSGAR